jgi:Ala-tRNA(Pro) deacylase
MSIPQRLKSALESNHVSYSAVMHVPTYGSQFAAAVMHYPGKEVAKTVVLRTNASKLLAVLPASYHVNLRKLGVYVGNPVSLVDELECVKLFPDCEVGAFPPFGELYGLPVYLDETLAEDPEIVFNAGSRSDAIRMKTSDYLRLVNPKVCSFAERC